MFYRQRNSPHHKSDLEANVSVCSVAEKDNGGKPERKLSARVSLGTMLKLFCALVVSLGLFIVMGAVYSSVVSRDPCDVLKDATGRFAGTHRTLENGTVFEANVPKIIHQQWKVDTEVPKRYQAFYDSWHKLFPEPEYTHIYWSDATALKLIEEHYPWFLPVYNGYEFNIQRADAARYFILHHYGGIYADLDYEPLVNFWDVIPKDRIGLVESPYHYNEFVQNSFMTSPKGDPVWSLVFQELVAKKDKPVLQSTGPVLLDTALIGKHDDQYTFLPCELYHRIPLGETDKSPWATLFHREILGRYYPMKSCGNYYNPQCHLGLHHNTATYISETGILKLLI